MAVFLYTLSLKIIELFASLAGIFNHKAKVFTQGRKDWQNKLTRQLGNGTSPLLWVHASSVGEYEQGRPVIERFKAINPDFRVLVSFYSPSGYEAVKPDRIIDYTCYLPFDSSSNAVNFIALVKPELALFIKYEFWHFYLDELVKQKIPTFSVSSIFRPQQAFFKWYGSFFRKMLENIDYFFVQDEASQKLLKSISIDSMITGDTRLDRVLSIRDTDVSFPIIDEFVKENPVFIIGSMRKEDIDLVLEFIEQTPAYKFIVAPHEITEEMMRPLEAKFNCSRYSKNGNKSDDSRVLIIDSIGILSKIYRYAHFAYIGGGLSDGIHNILEPAVYRIPVFFGNKDYGRFKEAIDLKAIGAAFPVASASEMINIHQELKKDPNKLIGIKQQIEAYIDLNKGASEKINEYLNNFSR